MQSGSQHQESQETFDQIARELQLLRESSGPVSYAELVRRITELRIQRGADPAASTPARSTVYDAFRPGRVRIDPALIRDIVLALGATAEEANRWVLRCDAARHSLPAAGPARAGAVAPSPQRTLQPSPGEKRSFRTVLRKPHSLGFVIPFLLGCVLLNFCGDIFVRALAVPLYLDMVGTAVAAIVLGPWWGAGIAVLSNLVSMPVRGTDTGVMALVGVAGALAWGYGVRKLNLGRDLSGFFMLGILTAVVCTVVAVPILLTVYGGGNGHAGDQIWQRFTESGTPLPIAVFAANITTSTMDKLLTIFIALTVFAALHSKLRISAQHMPLVERIVSEHVAERGFRGTAPGAMRTPSLGLQPRGA